MPAVPFADPVSIVGLDLYGLGEPFLSMYVVDTATGEGGTVFAVVPEPSPVFLWASVSMGWWRGGGLAKRVLIRCDRRFFCSMGKREQPESEEKEGKRADDPGLVLTAKGVPVDQSAIAGFVTASKRRSCRPTDEVPIVERGRPKRSE